MNKKILIGIVIVIAIVVVLGIIIGNRNSGKDSKQFKEVAHICNNLGGLPGIQITSPKVVDVWYFEEDDHSGKDVIVCFTGENTSSNYYQYFMWNGESTDYTSMCYAKDEVHTSNIIMNSKYDTQEAKLNCAGLMLQAMKSENKIESKQIEKLNTILNSGKIKQYADYKINK